MIISKIKLINWKNFLEAETALQERVFVVGANATGKSNFLDVFVFLNDLARTGGGLQQAVDIRGGVSSIRNAAATDKSYIGIEVHLANKPKDEPEYIYSIKFKGAGGGIVKSVAQIVEEKAWSKKADKWVLNRSEKNKKENHTTLQYTYLQQVSANEEFREVYRFFNDINYVNIIPQIIREPSSSNVAEKKFDAYGRNLIEKIGLTNEKTRNSYLKKLNDVLKAAVPDFESLKFSKQNGKENHLHIKFKSWRSKTELHNETKFSDGTLRIIGMMWALIDGQGTVLIEEPESYLHSGIVKLLPEFFYKFQRKSKYTRQVIISTHSYELLSNEGVGAEETIVLRPGKGTQLSNAMKIEHIKAMLDAGFNMAESVLPAITPTTINELTLNI